MRLIDADKLKEDDELTLWLSNDAVRTGKTLKMFSELFVKKIDEQPTICCKDCKWIPVSEKLPGKDICEAPGPAWKRKVLITGYYFWNSKEDTFIGVAFAKDVKNDSIQNVNVIAWMPYPEIYKESEVEE